MLGNFKPGEARLFQVCSGEERLFQLR